jgi:uncharacterized membrane protein YqaE (UPF0057 family)
MGNAVAKSLSISFFIAAALLGLFGAVATGTDQRSAMIQIVLAVIMLGAGLYVRTGSAEGRLVGLAAAAGTTAFGAYDMFTGHGYIPGTIVAIFVLFRLASAGGHFGTDAGQQSAPGQPAYPAQPYAQPYTQPYAQPYAQQPYPAQPPAGPVMPPPAAPVAPPDPRFGP